MLGMNLERVDKKVIGQMNTRLLDGMVIFAQVIEHGSFTHAAHASGHSTSFISKEINKLEERLGVRLLNRTTRSISMTPEGERYHQACLNVIEEAQQVEQQLAGHQLEPQGHLKVSCPVSFGLSRIRPILADYMTQFPKVTVELVLDDRKVDMVSEGFDVVVRASNQLEDSSLVSRRIMSSRGVIIASPEYLQKYGRPEHPSELSEHKTIAYSLAKNEHIWRFEHVNGEEVSVRVNSHLTTNSGEMDLALCQAGQGITRIPYFNLDGQIERGELVELFTDFVPWKIDVYLIYPSRKHLSSKVRSFIDYMAQAFD